MFWEHSRATSSRTTTCSQSSSVSRTQSLVVNARRPEATVLGPLLTSLNLSGFVAANWLRVLQLLLTSCSIRSNLLPQCTSLFFPRGHCMMSTTAPTPAPTPIPVQLSESEFTAFILPHLSMPKRGPKCKLGYYRVFNFILWVLYTGVVSL